MKTPAINELIIVEGKNDAHVLRRALGEIEVVWTDGFGLTREKIAYIRKAAQERGAIVCTDPDHAGESIRSRLDRHVPGLKHVYLPRVKARNSRGDDIGWENASSDAVREVFAKVQTTPGEAALPLYEMVDLRECGLSGSTQSRWLRECVARRLGIGECNAKQFLFRLNRFCIPRDVFLAAVAETKIGG